MVGEEESRWELWNVATDAAINAGLRSEIISLPDGVVFPERIGQPEGLSAEEYFRNLLDEHEYQNIMQSEIINLNDRPENITVEQWIEMAKLLTVQQ